LLVRRIARAVVVSLVERKEPRALALQLGAHHDFAVVHRKVNDASAKLEQPLARIAVAPVLRDGVVHGLFGEAVLQLERGDRQAVDGACCTRRQREGPSAINSRGRWWCHSRGPAVR